MSAQGAPATPRRGEDATIRLRIRHINQLFHTLDPFPFRERDLDAQVEEYVVGSARELRSRGRLTISIHMPAPQARADASAQIADGFRNYFAARLDILSWELRALFRNGRDALAVGALVLAVALLIGNLAARALQPGFVRRFVEEGLIIVGWVANWKPIEVFLFEWWPIERKRQLYRRLADATVEVVEDLPTPGPGG